MPGTIPRSIHMHAKFSRSPTVVSEKRGIQTDRGMLQLYIVDKMQVSAVITV